MTKLRVLDLFSGIGGFSLGLERTGGFETVAFCEIEEYPRRVLAKHWPGVPIYDDVRTLTADTLRRDGIGVDVICGGFPCQDISSAGLRKGLEGERSGLWREYARLISELRPQFVIVENVADLLHRGLGAVLGDLAAVGYDAEWHCIPTCGLGADHIRDRVWIIAYPDSAGAQKPKQRGRKQRPPKMGKDAAIDHANANRSGLPGRVQARTLREDARAISPWIGLAFGAAPAFPGLNGAGSPVLGRGENGIPHRVDRVRAIGNAVVPQIPELIGRAILKAGISQ
jgi:DNA (cytosine-5)-methyltransferase 1